MPALSRFYGLIITIYPPPKEHPPAHFHVRYAEHKASISIESGEVLRGWLPARALKLVNDWYALHATELAVAWDQVQAGRQPSQIAPLD